MEILDAGYLLAVPATSNLTSRGLNCVGLTGVVFEVVTTVGAGINGTISFRGSNDPNAVLDAAPLATVTNHSGNNTAVGFTLAGATGVVTLAAVGNRRVMFLVSTPPRFVWVDWVFSSGGGAAPVVNVIPWSFMEDT